MRNRLDSRICILALALSFEVLLLPPICHAKVANDTRRMKRDVSARTMSQGARENAKEIQNSASLRRARNNGDSEEGNTYPERMHQIAKRSANVEISHDYNNIGTQHDSRLSRDVSTDYAEEANEGPAKERGGYDDDDETGDVAARVRRDLGRYTDQDERSSLYDDYEAKDVAKRGVLGGPEDYEEAEEESAGIPEDLAAIRESGATLNEEINARETRSDARVKRDRTILQPVDRTGSSSGDTSEIDGTGVAAPIDLAKVAESKIAANESPSRKASGIVESSKGSNKALVADGGASQIVESESSEVVARSNVVSEAREQPAGDNSNAEYEKRVVERIRRKIDSIKDEIRRDIETQRRVRQIQENNAKFDELLDREREDEEAVRRFEGEPIEKRQTVAKRSIRETKIDDAIASPGSDDRKRSSSGEQREESRPIATRESNASKEGRSVVRNEASVQAPSRKPLEKRRERARRTILVENHRDRTRKRRSRSDASEREDGSPVDRVSSSDLRASDKMASSSLASENENNEGERNPATAERLNSLASLTGSSQELSPRLAMEYKEAFGGLQSEPGSALARFKRIKRVLSGPDAKISGASDSTK